MKLADVMSSMGLSLYAEVGMILFLGAFIAVAIQLTRRQNQPDFERARMMPLDDDRPVDPIDPSSDDGEDR